MLSSVVFVIVAVVVVVVAAAAKACAEMRENARGWNRFGRLRHIEDGKTSRKTPQ